MNVLIYHNIFIISQACHKNLKPKGVIHLAGYEVSDSADNAKIEQLKALAKKLGIDAESLPLPEKFPAHTLALFHERRRDYFITAADEDEKKEWAEMFRTCCRKTKGKSYKAEHNTIPHSQKHASCNKYIEILQQTCYQQADSKMRLNDLQQLVDDKSVASCQQIIEQFVAS